MKKDPYVFIDHIRESIAAIETYTFGVNKATFLNTPQIQDAVFRRLEIIGEAANKLESEFKEQFPNIPWYKIVAMRNILIHEYFAVDLDQVWNTVQKDLIDLKNQLDKI
ncbi:MAG: hypothetical protein SRB2_02422 [Desulfobacteraceae bacterium Eth-SRB2]|nr:MAG: hypothetical protein SRB2_02422 [Desulfobacteraceae bacterium Eth-SRB2]